MKHVVTCKSNLNLIFYFLYMQIYKSYILNKSLTTHFPHKVEKTTHQ